MRAGYIDKLRVVVAAEYGDELFEKLPLPDGSVYNVALDIEGANRCVSRATYPLHTKHSRALAFTHSHELVSACFLGAPTDPILRTQKVSCTHSECAVEESVLHSQ